MKIRWLEKNVELAVLCGNIQEFFERRKFKVSSEKSDHAVTISAGKRINEDTLTVDVHVDGEPLDFTVEIKCRKVSESIHIFGQFLSMIGLGGFLLKRLDLLDAYKVLEQDFLGFLEETVSDLAGSENS